MNILLIHQYAGNKGDRAVAFAMCHLIKVIKPSANIVISTSSPEMWSNEPYYKENHIRFIGNSWDFSNAVPRFYWVALQKIQKYTFTILRTLYLKLGKNFLCSFFINPVFLHEAKKADLVLSVGGHHFTTLLSRDLVSSINYDAMATLSLGKSLICFSQSFGHFEFHNPKNEVLTKKILMNCKLLLPREPQGTGDLIKLGIPKNKIKETYESVITLNSLIDKYIVPSKRCKKVGIAIYATQKRASSIHENYVSSFVNICDYINKKGYEVYFFPMELKGTGPDDRFLIHEILTKVVHPSMCFVYDRDMTTEKHIKEVAKCQVFIGHKTHSTIFSMATGTPLIGIAYHVKAFEFMHQFGVEKYCIDDQKLSSKVLIDKFDQLVRELDNIGVKMFGAAKKMSNVVKADMEYILNYRTPMEKEQL